MKKEILIVLLFLGLASCEERTEKMENSRGIPGPEKVEALAPTIESREKELQEQGFQTERRMEGDSTYLMQQYFVAFLREGEQTDIADFEAARLRSQHEVYLNRLSNEGRAEISGTLPDHPEISEIIIFRTRNQGEADSLLNAAPIIDAGVLRAQVYPLWVDTGAAAE